LVFAKRGRKELRACGARAEPLEKTIVVLETFVKNARKASKATSQEGTAVLFAVGGRCDHVMCDRVRKKRSWRGQREARQQSVGKKE